MCIPKDNMNKSQYINKKKFETVVRGVLAGAQTDHRLTCGLLPAMALLESDPSSVLFCVVANTKPGDAESHMHAVLLQAFCYENDIPVVHVDCSEKLSHFCGMSNKEQNIECALVTRSEDTSWETPNQCLSKAEQKLTDFYNYDFPEAMIMIPPLT